MRSERPFNTYRTMRDLLGISLILIIMLVSACGQQEQRTSDPVVEQEAIEEAATGDELITELVGYWFDEMNQGETQFYEHWHVDGQGGYRGLGFVMAGADTVFIEELRLAKQADQWTYSARVSSQNEGEWIDFHQRSSEEGSLLFVNAQHDFPQTIHYEPHGFGNLEISDMP